MYRLYLNFDYEDDVFVLTYCGVRFFLNSVVITFFGFRDFLVCGFVSYLASRGVCEDFN